MTDEQSFEAGLGGWTIGATDVTVGGATIPWTAVVTPNLAVDGSKSLEIYVPNFTDAAKIWITRPLAAMPNHQYTVRISFELATADYGDANLFSLLAGALPSAPTTGASLEPTFRRSETGNGSPTSVGYKWIHKEFTSNVTTGSNGVIYPVVGIWGTFEVTRTYYIDKVRVTVE